jgi:zinc transporter
MSTQPTLKKFDPTYGSDEHGLVWSYRFVPGQPAQAVTAEDAGQILSAPMDNSQGEFFWLHFSLANKASESWLQRHLNLPDAFYDSLRSEVGATRLEQDAESLVALIHDVLFDFSFDASKVAATSLCIEPRLLVSARLRPLRSVDHLRAAVRAGESFRSPVELLAHLLRDQAGVLADILRQATARVDQIEDRLLANRISATRSEVGNLRRVLVRLQRLLAPEPAALFRLLNRPPAWMSNEDAQDLRQAAEEFSAVVSDSAVLVERVKLIQEELVASVNEQTNRTLHILTVVTVLALPINMVAGLFGMNVGGVPLAQQDHGFFVVVAILLLLTGLLAYLAFRRRD